MPHQDTHQSSSPHQPEEPAPNAPPAEAARDNTSADKPQDPPVITDYASL